MKVFSFITYEINVCIDAHFSKLLEDWDSKCRINLLQVVHRCNNLFIRKYNINNKVV